MFPADTPEVRATYDPTHARGRPLHSTDAMEPRVAADIVGLEAYGNGCLRLGDEFRSEIQGLAPAPSCTYIPPPMLTCA